MIKKRRRHTIQSGAVVTFARGFEKKDGWGLFHTYKALGNFEISASRERVIIHKGIIKDGMDARMLRVIMMLAYDQHCKLRRCRGRPDDDWDGDPRTVVETEEELLNMDFGND